MTVQFHPKPGVFSRESYQIVLKIQTAAGFHPRDFEPQSPDTRVLGVFVKPVYEVK